MPDIDNLSIQISANDTRAVDGLEKLARTLERLKTAVNGAAPTNAESRRLREFGQALNSLRGAENIRISPTIATQFGRIGQAISKITSGEISRVRELADAMRGLSGVGAGTGMSFPVGGGAGHTAARPAGGATVPDIGARVADTVDVSVSPDSLSEIAAAGSDATESLSGLASAGASAATGVSDVVTVTAPATDGLGDVASEGSRAAETLGDVASESRGTARPLSDVARSANNVGVAVRSAAKHNQTFLLSIIRIAKYRLIRSVLKDMVQGFKDLYGYSMANGLDFAKSVDTITTSTTYLRNSLVAMVAPLVNMLAPAVDFIVDKFVGLLNIINQFIAALTGAATYTAAKKYATTWEDTFKGTSSGAKKAADDIKRTILGFDEINKLQKDRDNAGGGGSGSSPYTEGYKEMFEERAVSSTISSIAEKIRSVVGPVFDWVKTNFDSILPVVEAIGAAMLLWKFAGSLIPNMESLEALLGKIGSIVGGLVTATITVALTYHFANDFINSGNVGSLVADGLTGVLGSAITGLVVAKSFGAQAGIYAASATLLLAAATNLSVSIKDIVNNGITKNNLLVGVLGIVEGAAAGFMVTKSVSGAVMGASLALSIALVVGAIDILKKEGGASIKFLGLAVGASLAASVAGAKIATTFFKDIITSSAGALTLGGIVLSVLMTIGAIDILNKEGGASIKFLGLAVGASLAASVAGAKIATTFFKDTITSSAGALMLGGIMLSVLMTIGAIDILNKEGGASIKFLGLAVGASLAASVAGAKIATTFFKDTITSSAGALMLGGIMLSVFMTIGAIDILNKEGGASINFLGLAVGASLAAATAGVKIATTFFKNVITPVGGGLVLGGITLSALLTLGAIDVAKKEGTTSINFLGLAVGATLSASVAIAKIATTFFTGITPVAGALVLGGIALTALLTITAINVTKDEKDVKWGEKSLTPEEIQEEVQKRFTFNIPATIKLVGTTIENMSTAKENLDFNTQLFSATLNKIELGVGLDNSDGTIDDMLKQLEEIKTSFYEKQGADKAALELAISLAPPKDEEGNLLDAAGILQAFNGAQTATNTAVEQFGAELAALLNKGFSDELAAQEQARITELSNWILNITSAGQIGAITGGYEAKMKTAFALTDLDEDSFKGLVDTYISEAGRLKDSLLEASQAGYTALKSRRDELQATIDAYIADGKTVSQDMIDNLALLDEQIANWSPLESVEEKMKEEMEPFKQEMLKSLLEIYGGAFETFRDEIQYNATLNDLLRFIDPDSTSIEDIANYVQGAFDQALSDALGDDYEYVMDMSEKLGFTGWDVIGLDAQKAFYDELKDKLGDEKAKQVLESLGYDLTGVLADGMADGKKQIPDAATQIANKFKTSLSNWSKDKKKLLTPAANIGIAVVNGLVNGLSNKTNNKKNSILSIFGKVVDFAKTAFDSHSPSKVFEKIGKDIVSGMINGLDTIQSKLKKTWSNLPNWFKEKAQTIISYLKGSDFTNAGETAAKNVKDGMTKVEMPTLAPVVNLVKEGWETVSGWVSNNKGDTPVDQDVGVERKGFSSVAEWIKDNFMGDNVNKEVGVARKSTFTTVAAWLLGSWMGGNVNKEVGVARKSTFTTVAAWLLGSWMGGNVNKEVGVARKSTFTTVAAWLLGSWMGGNVNKEVGVARKSTFTTVAAWLLGSWMGGNVNKEVGVARKSTFTTVAEWLLGSWMGGNVNKDVGVTRNSNFTTVADWLKEKWMGGGVNKEVGVARDTNVFTSVAQWIKDNWMGGNVDQKVDLAKNGWDWVNVWASGFAQTPIGQLVNLAQNGWDWVDNWAKQFAQTPIDQKVNLVLNKNKIVLTSDAHDKVTWTADVKARGGVFSNGMWHSIPQYAGGTINAHGSLFMAGEAGPEIVGHIGGRTEVLNKSQLAATMYAAVNSAMQGVTLDANFYGNPDGEMDGESFAEMLDYMRQDSDATRQQNELLRQQNELLRQLNEKELSISTSQINRAQSYANRRAGVTVAPVGT